MAVTVTYDVLGGMKAVVISDVVQMALLIVAVLLALAVLFPDLQAEWPALAERTAPLLDDWGVSGTGNYGLWPMLFGGLFLYMAYYGCDQSQAQRLLSAADEASLQRVLLLNGLLRFPLVLAYCLLGLGLAAYAAGQPDFLQQLPRTGAGQPNLNLVFPAFVTREFAPGLAGLAIVGLFAAAMSSIDSALNSLSASTLEDFFPASESRGERHFFLLSKPLTLAWGVFAVAFSFSVEHIAPTILEAINKIGSMANGPLLALFVLALLRPGSGPVAALSGFACGLLGNLLLWTLAPGVSWLWWNPAGFFATLIPALLLGGRQRLAMPGLTPPPRRLTLQLLLGFLAMAALLVALQWPFIQG
jgi:SSS family solute:Na+ symporter